MIVEHKRKTGAWQDMGRGGKGRVVVGGPSPSPEALFCKGGIVSYPLRWNRQPYFFDGIYNSSPRGVFPDTDYDYFAAAE